MARYGCNTLTGWLPPTVEILPGLKVVFGALVVYIFNMLAFGPEPDDGPADR